MSDVVSMLVSIVSSVLKLVLYFPRYLENWLAWLIVLGETPACAPALVPVAKVPVGVLTPPSSPATSNYVVSSLLLHQCYRYLAQGQAENLHLVTGVLLEDRFILTDMVAVPNVDRAAAGAFASANDIREGLLTMEQFGLRCGGLFHSHPGTGSGSTVPSSTDWKNQRIWERAFPLVGGVFSQDAVVRFFTCRPNVRVEVRGRR